jgi:hypothetical protein
VGVKKMIPKHLQSILWSKGLDKLSLEDDKNYIVHQVLMYGDLKDIKWLFETYSRAKVREIFVQQPKRVYTAPTFNFVKNFVLGLKGKKLEEDKYVKSTF